MGGEATDFMGVGGFAHPHKIGKNQKKTERMVKLTPRKEKALQALLVSRTRAEAAEPE